MVDFSFVVDVFVVVVIVVVVAFHRLHLFIASLNL